MAKILIVEDQKENVDILDRLLRRSNHEVAITDNKAEAIEMATSESPDLILMDIEIPEVKDGHTVQTAGLDATRAIKSAPETSGIPIIALTARVMMNEKEQIAEAGCDDLQEKPYQFSDLLGAIDQHLKAGNDA